MARIQCAGCRGKFDTDETNLGQVIPCPLCGFLLRLPGLQIPPGTIIAGYRIEKMIAIGGMGEVYRATQLSMERQVALKLLSPSVTADKEALADFLREVRMLARLTHPNIVEAIEAGEDNGLYYLSMSFVDGETLENLLKNGPMREREALEIARTVAETLKYAWDKHRMLHRDIKPGNIMLDRRGRVALMDLGIAKIVDEGAGGRATIVHGTPQYMSPEQANGLENLDSRADIYSLGATLYHLLTGREIFPGNDHDHILKQQIHERPTPPRKINPDISAPCEALLLGLLEKNRDHRPSDWAAAIHQITRVLDKRHPTGEIGADAGRSDKNGRKTLTTSRRGGKPRGRRDMPAEPTPKGTVRIKGKKDPMPPPKSVNGKTARGAGRPRPVYRPASNSGKNMLVICIGIGMLFLLLLIFMANR